MFMKLAPFVVGEFRGLLMDGVGRVLVSLDSIKGPLVGTPSFLGSYR